MIKKIHKHLDSVTSFLKPYLPLVNCHMVEFLTNDHWNNLVPSRLRAKLETWDLDKALEIFWKTANEDVEGESCELSKWVHSARRHHLSTNNEYSLSRDAVSERILSWGGRLYPEIRIHQFMNSKKSYEVETMSSIVAGVLSASNAACCIEVGGGRGALLAALTLGYHVPSLTVDCDQKTIDIAVHRAQHIQRQWHAIAARVDGNNHIIPETAIPKDLHRFARSYVTESTDLSSLVAQHFPQLGEGASVLLTGLHTCGNLGPSSLRLFTQQPSVAAIFNVPCCYHLLTETVDEQLFDVFERDYGPFRDKYDGFPMSEHLRGWSLGRNARMLAAQSLARVAIARQTPSRSLLHRALLQVIIKKYLPDTTLPGGKMKKIPPCDDFQHYVAAVSKLLKTNLSDSLPKDYLKDIDINVSWKRIVMFYLLRLCLAQVVECVILLDRLLYLKEARFEKAFLVRLFDPVLSPRCHALVAMR